MLIYTQQLDVAVLRALDALVEACKQTDGNTVAIYRDLLAQHRSKPCSLLYYAHDQLVGFAGVFFFEQEVGEITLLVHPAHRKQGIGHKLFKNIQNLITKDRPVHTLCFSTPHNLYSSEQLLSRGFEYQGSEYDMQRDGNTPLAINSTLVVHQATFDDIDTLCAIDNRCFTSQYPSSETRFSELLLRPEYCIFLGLIDNTIIGKAHLAWQDKKARLSDIAILPAMQKQGFGRALITHCINYALTLSVETHNQHALHLYQHLGFGLSNAIDYWSISFEAIY